MPRAIRKSRRKCSNVCRKRHSLRDNVDLSYIREALRSSTTSHRYSPLKRETIKKSSNEPKIGPESNKEPKLLEDTSTSVKPKSIIEHGIRYIMLPLHLFNICVRGSPAQTSLSKEPKNTSSKKCEEKETKKFSPTVTRKVFSLSSRTSSPASSSSGFSSSSSVSSKSLKINPTESPSCILSSHLPIDLLISPSTSSQFPVKPPSLISSSASSNIRETQSDSSPSSASRSIKESPRVPLNQLCKEESSDDSSDEIVTAPEDFDDSSNDQWSNARSSSFMNMSIDLEYNSLEKSSFNLISDRPHEEPMDVSMEETNFQANLFRKLPSHGTKKKSIDERSTENSSSSSIEDLRSSEDFSNSSIDREIARIFQQACTSSSSDDEDYPIMRGRSNDPFVDGSTHTGILEYRSCIREEINDSAMRKKRAFCHHAHTTANFQTKRSHRDYSENPFRLEDRIDLFKVRESKEDHEKRDLREAGRKIYHQTDSAHLDEDVEMNFMNESLSRLQSIPMSLQESVIEWMEQDLDYVADTEDSTDGSPLPLRSRINSVGEIASGNLKNDDFGFVGRENRERLNFNVEINGNQRPVEFRNNPGNQYEASCRCGDPKCLFKSVALRSDDGASSWRGNYPRAPSPLRHLYYEYPEFMTPPTVAPKIDKSLPWILIPCSANLA